LYSPPFFFGITPVESDSTGKVHFTYPPLFLRQKSEKQKTEAPQSEFLQAGKPPFAVSFLLARTY